MTDLGGIQQIAVDIADAGGVPADPAVATLTITLPDGTTATPVVPLPSAAAGQLRVDYLPPQPGRYTWRLITTSPTTAYADTFDVSAAVPPGVVSLARTKKQLNIKAPDTSDDDELRGYIRAATGAIEEHLGRVVARRSVTERRTLTGPAPMLLLSCAPAITLTSVVRLDAPQTWDVSPDVLDLDPDTGMVTVLTGPPLQGLLRMVYDAGMAVVPERYQLAALIIIQHLWDTQRGVMGAQLGGGDDAYTPGRGFAIPRRALELLGSPLPGVA